LPAKSLRGRIYFDVETTKRLSELIAPCVPPPMRYKLDPAVAEAIPFDPANWEIGQKQVDFDEIELVDVSDRYRCDKTFFCIDVEETHNFVTAGGVVHNCRPPGNRDPQPLEIEACKPYLMKQVELIQPKVIGTLGNFATKLLTGNPTGITKVRGTPQVHELGGTTVFLMPLLHPAAALRTPSLVETLREDFANLSTLLDQEPPAPRTDDDEVALVAAEAPEPDADQLDLFG
jgi:uracil-DNA glycosylase family 4